MANLTVHQVCFVQTGESSELLKRAFEAMNSNQLAPTWVSIEDCLNIFKKETKIFVLDPFEGAVFEQLKTLRFRILGPLCFLFCLEYNGFLPNRSYPLKSLSMYKITVSCSSIQDQRDEICNKVLLMGGFFSKDLNESVTHLVVGEVGSQKYKVAANCGLPIMVPEWITDVWENGQYEKLHASDRCYDKYKCPIFKGLVITVSQLSEEERLTIKRVIEYNGGSYSGSLKSNETTHLILNEPTGDKYRFAKSCKVICVNAKWVLDSLESGYCRDEAFYGIDETSQSRPKTSTRMNDLTSCKRPLAGCSFIVGQPGVSHQDETMRKEFSINLTNKRNSYVPLDEFNLSTLQKYGQFLDGCKIFLTGFNTSHMDKLKRIINSGSGMRFSKYSDSISHVVCGKLSDDLLKSIKSSITNPFVVNYEWLLDCCKSDKILDEKPYLCLDINKLTQEEEQEDIPKLDISIHMSQNRSQVKKDDILDEEMSEIFKQYISEPQLEDDKENKGFNLENQNNSFKPPLPVDGANKSLSIHGVKHNSFPQTDVPLQHTRINKLCNGIRRESIHRSSPDRPSAGNSLRTSAILDGKFKFQMNGILKDLHEKENKDFNLENQENSFKSKPLPVDGAKKSLSIQGVKHNGFPQTDVPLQHTRINKLCNGIRRESIHRSSPDRPSARNSLRASASLDGKFKFQMNGILKDLHEKENKDFNLENQKNSFKSKPLPVDGAKKSLSIHGVKHNGLPQTDIPLQHTGINKLCNGSWRESMNRSSPNRRSAENSLRASASLDGNIKFQMNGILKDLHEKENKDFNLENQKNSFKSKPLPVDCAKKSLSIRAVKHNGLPQTDIPLQHTSINKLCNGSWRESINRSSPNRPSAKNSLKASASLDGNIKFHRNGILKDLHNSRESFCNSEKHSLSLGEMFSRTLSVALTRVDATSNFGKADSKVFEKNDNKSDKPAVLSGVVLYVSRKLCNMQIVLHKIVVELGGTYIWLYDDSCTHFVFVGKANDTTKEFREARNKGKKIVSPDWIYACKNMKSHLEEYFYPHTRTCKANRTLSQHMSILKTVPSPVDAAKSLSKKRNLSTASHQSKSKKICLR